MDREEINQPASDPLENKLRQFTPRASGIDRDRLMFLAGQEAGGERPEARVTRRALGLWPVATFVSSGVAACFAIALGLQMMQPPRERVIVREVLVQPPQTAIVAQVPATPATVPARHSLPSPIGLSLPAGSLLQMRNVALRFGVEALPTDRAVSTSTATAPSPISPWQQLRDSAVDTDSSL
jgi:hypothetical protein